MTIFSVASLRIFRRPRILVFTVTAALAACSLVVTAPSVQAADAIKIGIVDLQKILESSEGGKEWREKMKKEIEVRESELKKQGSELEDLKTKLERETAALSKEARETKERDFKNKVTDFRALEKKYRNEIQEMQLKLSGEIQKDVFQIAEEIGKKDGYLLILEKREAGIFYSPKNIDITDRLIQEYNNRHPKKKP
jgi:outer membrane protein